MESFPYYCGFTLPSTKLETVSVFPKFGFYSEGPIWEYSVECGDRRVAYFSYNLLSLDTYWFCVVINSGGFFSSGVSGTHPSPVQFGRFPSPGTDPRPYRLCPERVSASPSSCAPLTRTEIGVPPYATLAAWMALLPVLVNSQSHLHSRSVNGFIRSHSPLWRSFHRFPIQKNFGTILQAKNFGEIPPGEKFWANLPGRIFWPELLWGEKIGECVRGYICYTYTARRQEVSYGFLFPG